jgi:hypothetical protein
VISSRKSADLKSTIGDRATLTDDEKCAAAESDSDQAGANAIATDTRRAVDTTTFAWLKPSRSIIAIIYTLNSEPTTNNRDQQPTTTSCAPIPSPSWPLISSR